MEGELIVVVVGLGYVGLPLAACLSKYHKVVGIDKSLDRVEQLRSGVDQTLEVGNEELNLLADFLTPQEFKRSEVVESGQVCAFILCLPTPVSANNCPDLSILLEGCEFAGNSLQSGDVVIFESTVYPGCTEGVCIPRLEEASGLFEGTDFYVAYSPERINPGSGNRKVSEIVKVIAAGNSDATRLARLIYEPAIAAGVHLCSSIKVGELAKVIENTQRDLNIALMNAVSDLCEAERISTREVLAAAGTKWNFLSFTPGLVGGHCIGVDPYYLLDRANSLRVESCSTLISASRMVNELAVGRLVRKISLISKKNHCSGAQRILVLGCSFKANVPDIRNSKVFPMVLELKNYGYEVDLVDPLVAPTTKKANGVNVLAGVPVSNKNYNLIVLAVWHDLIDDNFLVKCNEYLAKDGEFVKVYEGPGWIEKSLL